MRCQGPEIALNESHGLMWESQRDRRNINIIVVIVVAFSESEFSNLKAYVCVEISTL